VAQANTGARIFSAMSLSDGEGSGASRTNSFKMSDGNNSFEMSDGDDQADDPESVCEDRADGPRRVCEDLADGPRRVCEDRADRRETSLSVGTSSGSDLSLSEPDDDGNVSSTSRVPQHVGLYGSAVVLPPFGWVRAGEIGQLQGPRFCACPGLGIVLRPAPVSARPPRRLAPLLPLGNAVVVQRYGTPRLFPCSQRTSRWLTRRNYRELPTILHFDEKHRAEVGAEWQARVVVSPTFAEWLMGMPRGWTDTQPLSPKSMQSHALGDVTAAGVSAVARRRRTLSLFSGCGALDLGLLERCVPIAYCESCPAAAQILRSRMSDGVLPDAPVHADVCKLRAADLHSEVEGIAVGFPCQDISIAGQQCGFEGQRSCLVFEALRLAGETKCQWIFMENVSHILRMSRVWRSLFAALESQGFGMKWCTVGACHVGSPQRRMRWFGVARRHNLESMQRVLPDGRQPCFVEHSSIRFNGGRPLAEQWLLLARDHPQVAERLNMVGNAVVPLQANLAARVLDL